MKRPRRGFLQLAAGAAALAVSRTAPAQAYLAPPIRLIVGFPAGGPTDITARVMAQWLSERLGQQIVIESRAGAGSNFAVEAAINAPPDGYTPDRQPAEFGPNHLHGVRYRGEAKRRSI
jgi:tripartite-type tricarboxylate transporter receptor subunit TctC